MGDCNYTRLWITHCFPACTVRVRALLLVNLLLKMSPRETCAARRFLTREMLQAEREGKLRGGLQEAGRACRLPHEPTELSGCNSQEGISEPNPAGSKLHIWDKLVIKQT